MFKKISMILNKFYLFLKNIIIKILENISNICIIICVACMIYTPFFLLNASTYFDILKYSLMFIFFIISVLIISKK